MDGIAPDCMAEAGCPIPQLDETGQRILQIRGHLVTLQPTVDAGTICRIHNVDRDDLDLLMVVEEQLREQVRKEPDDGP